MAGNVELRIEGGRARLALFGRIDQRSRPAFRQGGERAIADPRVREVVVDLRRASFLDGVSLGLLLVMRERAWARSLAFAVLPAEGAVRESLRLVDLGGAEAPDRVAARAA
jgi:anti-anti-sigma factor